MTFRILALAFATIGLLPAQEAAHWTGPTRRIVLDNGLTVLMLQRGELPIVSVQALYRVGSRNERPGQTGAAHFVEHMAFRSTEEIAKQDLTNQILRWGGRWNGYTSYDQTVYGSHTPSEYLEWLIYLERQRMRHVRWDAHEVERERTSVISEERQYQNSPAYALVEHRLRRAALVAHPYGSPIMGRMSDLEGVTARELETFYRQHYAPNSLILSIVGRFDPDRALALVTKHFGDVPGDGTSTAIRTIEPGQNGERRVVMRTRSGRSHLELVVHAPAASSSDFATLLLLDGVLAGVKSPGRGEARDGSRLHRALVGPGLANAVTTEVELSEYPALYSIGVDAGRDADLQAIESRLHSALQDAMRSVTEEEVRRAARQIRADLAFGADSNRAVANLLAVYEQMGSFTLLAAIPDRLNGIGADAVRAFARERLAPDRRSTGVLVPQPEAASASTRAQSLPASPLTPESPAAATPARRTLRPVPPPRLELPGLPQPVVRRLDNGVTILAVRIPGESAHIRVRVAAGSRFDPAGREGTALLAGRLLAGGRTAPLRALEDRDARVSLSAFDDDEPFATRNFVEIAARLFPGDLVAAARDIVSTLRSPTFHVEDVDRHGSALAGEMASRQDDSRWRADRAAFDRLYEASDPYGRPPEGTADSRMRITTRVLSAFHRAYYRPERTIVAIAGPFDPAATIEQVAGAFNGWRPDPAAPPPESSAGAGGHTASRPAPRTAPASTPRERIVHVPLEKEQASIAVALPGIPRKDDEFAALAALNYLLGETGYAGRLGERLVDTGLAYAVYSSVLADREAGPIFITTEAVRAREAVTRILDTLEEFARRGITDAELREAKGFLLGRLLFRFESATAASAALADIGYFGGDAAPEAFARRVLSLTREEVSSAARRYYDPSRAVAIVAGRY